MTNGYTTVFKVSYFSNGTLFFSVVALFACLFAAGVAAVIYGRLTSAQAEAARKTFFYFRLVPLVCAGFSAIWLLSNLYSGYNLTHALSNGQCGVVEGIVHVVRQEPWDGRGGTIIEIGGKKFGYSSHQDKLGYRGGELRVGGVAARVHYIGNTILKVEIKE
jgi:hypothetical protein